MHEMGPAGRLDLKADPCANLRARGRQYPRPFSVETAGIRTVIKKRHDPMTKDMLPVKPRLNINDCLVKVLGLSRKALPSIRDEARAMIRDVRPAYGDAPEPELLFQVSSRLINRSALRAGMVGGITATPAALPVIGTLGTVLIGTAADFGYLIRTQIELCYAISAVYDTHIDEEELMAITLSLLGFSGTGQMVKEIAASTLRNLVDATAAVYLKRGMTHAASEVAAKITPRLMGRAYKLIPFISIPLSASINIASTMMVGNQARKYFSIWQKSEQCYFATVNGRQRLDGLLPPRDKPSQ